MSVQLLLGDCLERMKEIQDASVDMVMADLPYGTTACKWDSVIPFAPLWTEYRRVCKKGAAIVLTASQPFTSALVMSNAREFRYCWVWDKVNKNTGFQMVNKRPMKRHEDIAVFYQQQPTYNAQKEICRPYKSRRSQAKSSDTQGTNAVDYGRTITTRSPCSVLCVAGNMTANVLHPTQKPVALMEYLIRTYTNPVQLVLDNTMGSGTTGVACINTGRSFIGIERDPGYFKIAEDRIHTAESALPICEFDL